MVTSGGAPATMVALNKKTGAVMQIYFERGLPNGSFKQPDANST